MLCKYNVHKLQIALVSNIHVFATKKTTIYGIDVNEQGKKSAVL